MTEVEFREEPSVRLIDWMPRGVPGDHRVVEAARVSSGTAPDERRDKGLLRMLLRDRHGSPFEHVVFTWLIECPVFVSREFFRHRIASYNETSSRYRELEPVFYMPPHDRPLVQKGRPGAYTFTEGSPNQQAVTVVQHDKVARAAWDAYQDMLARGVAREVARNVLPLSIYTSFYVTMNLRSFLNFLSLRWAHPDSEVPTFPLFEIQQVAEFMEASVSHIVPTILDNFTEFGRRPV